MTAAGVLAGANMTFIATASYPGNPDAATVGTPGTNGVGFAVVTASAFNLPDFIWGATDPDVANISCT